MVVSRMDEIHGVEIPRRDRDNEQAEIQSGRHSRSGVAVMNTLHEGDGRKSKNRLKHNDAALKALASRTRHMEHAGTGEVEPASIYLRTTTRTQRRGKLKQKAAFQNPAQHLGVGESRYHNARKRQEKTSKIAISLVVYSRQNWVSQDVCLERKEP